MKNTIKTLLTLAFLAVMSVTFQACQDEPYKYEATDGVPTVYYIRPAGAAQDTLLTSAYMQNSLCIVGDNLRSVYQIFFNDVEAVLNNAYITDNTLLVDVPNSIPGEVSNKIYFITKSGETVTYDFSILVPGPSLSSMSCEWAAEGGEATLSGDYFVDDPNVPLTVTFEGGLTAPIKSFTKTLITITVPEGAKEGPVEVSTVYGSVKSGFHYKDSRGLLFDFDTNPLLTNHGWHAQVIETDDTALSGNFLRLGDPEVTMTAEGGWNDGNFSFEYWCGDGGWSETDYVTYTGAPKLTDIVDFSDWTNMSLKFEMYIPAANPWAAGMMQLIFGGVDKITGGGNKAPDVYGEVVGGANNTFFNSNVLPRGIYQPWVTAGAFSTDDRWITVTVPLSNFIYGFDGTQATGQLKASDFASLTIFVVGGVEGAECQPVIKIDNIRAVPNE